MAKKSTDIVNEEADYEQRFEKLETNAAESKELLIRLAEKILGDPKEKLEPKKKDEKSEPPVEKKNGGVLGWLRDNGILASEKSE